MIDIIDELVISKDTVYPYIDVFYINGVMSPSNMRLNPMTKLINKPSKSIECVDIELSIINKYRELSLNVDDSIDKDFTLDVDVTDPFNTSEIVNRRILTRIIVMSNIIAAECRMGPATDVIVPKIHTGFVEGGYAAGIKIHYMDIPDFIVFRKDETKVVKDIEYERPPNTNILLCYDETKTKYSIEEVGDIHKKFRSFRVNLDG